MNEFFYWFTLCVGLAMVLSLYRVLRGPTVFDRLTGLNLIGTKTVILLLAYGFLINREEIFVDLSVAYALFGFIGPVALAKYFEQPDFEEMEEDDS